MASYSYSIIRGQIKPKICGMDFSFSQPLPLRLEHRLNLKRRLVSSGWPNDQALENYESCALTLHLKKIHWRIGSGDQWSAVVVVVVMVVVVILCWSGEKWQHSVLWHRDGATHRCIIIPIGFVHIISIKSQYRIQNTELSQYRMLPSKNTRFSQLAQQMHTEVPWFSLHQHQHNLDQPKYKRNTLIVFSGKFSSFASSHLFGLTQISDHSGGTPSSNSWYLEM